MSPVDPARILARLDELRRLDPARRLFGADTHVHALAPPVDAALLARAEAALGAPLPEDYRRFLVEVGDGGAGPYHGVLSLAESIARCALNDAPMDSLPAFTRDFPLAADVDFGTLAGKPASWDEHVRRLAHEPAYAARWDELREEYAAPPFDGGWLPICDYGCGDFFFLVVRGPRRGTVWVNSVDSATGLYCLEVSFGAFHERWLEDALRRVRAGDFAPGTGHLEYGKRPGR